MQGVNPFVLCNLAARFTRKTFRSYSTATLEQSLKANTRIAVAYLKAGNRAELDAKNMRQAGLSFIPEEICVQSSGTLLRTDDETE